MRIVVLATVVGALIGVASPNAGVSKTRLILSTHSGPAGTRVEVRGVGCTKPFGQRDTLAWHDHYYWLHDAEKRPPLGVWRRVPVVRTSPTTARAVFVVQRTDHLGQGLLDLFCGGDTNAIATFTVTR
jgi:hypothetical protein